MISTVWTCAWATIRKTGSKMAILFLLMTWVQVTFASLNSTLFSNVHVLLRRFSRVRLCATPETAAHQDPPSLGFSRQEYCSGLPLPSPMCESEVAQSCPIPDYQAPPPMGFSRQEYWSGLPLPSPTYISFCKMHQHYDSLEVLKFYDGAPDDAMLNPISHVSTKQVFSSFSFWCFWILAFQGER